MRSLLLTVCLLITFGNQCLADYTSSNYFCKDLHGQRIINIGELEGMWYLMEKIVHTDERHITHNLTTCSIIYISEDRGFYPTRSTLYKNVDTPTYYGRGYPYNSAKTASKGRNPTDPLTTFSSEQDFIERNREYDQKTTYDYERRQVMYPNYLMQYTGEKRLKMYISDGGSSVEHHLKYDTSNPGFWIMSGAEEGAQTGSRHFIGIIQVLKAVGNHLVLTTCQSSSEAKQLYTMILSRESYLTSWQIHSIHSMLIKQGLRTNYKEITCSSGNLINCNYCWLYLVLISIYVLA